ncbi:hypothetical protein EVAR_27307_1 [Eumeta japonica]|uniref:Uncharacterized protein n=1 Tax=Eumeta variegata TaxID=151549 RepID=A0A4C1UDT1_EUMVA|nr:hypothetical protein EVAR_27307_1 [Eumeta japonica]
MPRKEHIRPATTARDDKHHDGSGIVTRAQAAAASSDRLVGGTTVPVSDLRDGADPSPCMSAPTATLHHFWLEFLKISWLPCFRPWPGHKRSQSYSYTIIIGTGAERRWNDLADPELCRSRVTVLQRRICTFWKFCKMHGSF